MQNSSAFATLGKILDKPILECDWQGKILNVNHAASHLFGLNNQEAHLEHLTECIPKSEKILQRLADRPPADDAGLITLVDQARVDGRTCLNEELSLEASILVLAQEGKKRLLVILRVLHSENYLSKHRIISRMLNQAKIPLCVIDEDGFFIEANDAYCLLFEYLHDALVGKHFTLLIPPEKRSRASDEHKAFFQHQNDIHAEWDCLTQSGKTITILVTANLLTNPDGRRFQLLTCQDITSHIQTEIKIQKEEAFMQHLVEFMDAGIGLLNKEGVFLRANIALSDIFGFRVDEFIGSSFPQLLNEQQRERAQVSLNEAYERDQVEEDEWELHFSDGLTRFIHTTLRRLVFPDGEVYLILTASDNSTQQKIKNALIQHKESAEKNLNEKHAFIYSLTRKIRSMTGPIMGFAELLNSTPLSTEQKEYCNTLAQNSQSLLDYSNKVLEYATLASEYYEPRMLDIELLPLLDEVLENIQDQLPALRIPIHKKVNENCPTHYQGDRVRLKKLLTHIASFVIKHSQKESLTLEIKSDSGLQEKESCQLKIQYSTSTPFRPPQSSSTPWPLFTERLEFLPEYNEESEIDLAICKCLANNFGAQVKQEILESGTFIVTLAIDLKVVSQSIDEEESPFKSLESRPLHTICADDNPSNQNVIKALISNLGHQITITSLASELIEKLKIEDFDLILLDINMPIMDGFEAAQRIRQGEAGEQNKNIYIIAVTAYKSDNTERRCQEVGINDLLYKPISRQRLNDALLSSKRFIFEHSKQ